MLQRVGDRLRASRRERARGVSVVRCAAASAAASSAPTAARAVRRSKPERTTSCPSRSAASGRRILRDAAGRARRRRRSAAPPARARRARASSRRARLGLHVAASARSDPRSIAAPAADGRAVFCGAKLPAGAPARSTAKHARQTRTRPDGDAIASVERKRRDSMLANVWPDASRMSVALRGTSDSTRIGSGGSDVRLIAPLRLPAPGDCML